MLGWNGTKIVEHFSNFFSLMYKHTRRPNLSFEISESVVSNYFPYKKRKKKKTGHKVFKLAASIMICLRRAFWRKIF